MFKNQALVSTEEKQRTAQLLLLSFPLDGAREESQGLAHARWHILWIKLQTYNTSSEKTIPN